ncbi:MAG: aldo/keto reductase [Acidobacteriota bacterium]|nr:aldo/keto reductase [Acidobacteriota bacterium]
MVATVRWGIIGPGAIARVFATAIDGLDGHEIVAVGSRDPQRAANFNAERDYRDAEAGTYRDLVRSESVDAVYVASPHSGHFEHAALALRHGKAVLCEKPLCVNASEARRLCAIARERGRPLLEAMWTRFLPATLRAADWVARGTIGEPSRVVASFGFHARFDPESRLFDPELAGGSLLDIGCYPLSLASLIFGERVTGGNVPQIEVRADLAPSGVDEHCKIVLRFGDGAEAYLESSINKTLSPTGVIQGARGRIVMPDFWRAQQLKLECETKDVATLECPFLCNGYEYQALELARMLRDGDVESPLLPHAESIGLIELMDELRRRMDVQYPFEPTIGVTAGTHRAMTYRPLASGRPSAGYSSPPSAAAGRKTRAPRAPLAVESPAEGNDVALGARVFRPASDATPRSGEPEFLPRLILGTMALTNDTQAAQDHADALLDAAFECGISAVDTGHVYGAGASERAIGDWLERRGLADEVFVLSKGCHPDATGPRVNPEALAQDLAESLDRLRLPAVDLYMLHRDDPAVPVGEMVDAFAEHLAAGRLGAYGFSNWTRARIEEACDYAEANDRPLPAASSPNFSLADQVKDPWGGGCVTLTGKAAADDREWHRSTGMAIFAWSSLARGLFSGRVTRRTLAADPALVDEACRTAYVHDVNLKRLERVIEFAEAGRATVPQIALAWVLAQDLPLHAIVGAATEEEVEDLAAAAALSLTEEEAEWLHTGGRRPLSMARETLARRLERQAVRIGRRLPGPIKRPIKRLVGRA